MKLHSPACNSWENAIFPPLIHQSGPRLLVVPCMFLLMVPNKEVSNSILNIPSPLLNQTSGQLDLGCSVILPGQWLASVMANRLLELSELSPRKVLTDQMCYPVE